jgi:hypothetical protein
MPAAIWVSWAMTVWAAAVLIAPGLFVPDVSSLGILQAARARIIISSSPIWRTGLRFIFDLLEFFLMIMHFSIMTIREWALFQVSILMWIDEKKAAWRSKRPSFTY